jgi:cytochrome b involved in lipid metabolism
MQGVESLLRITPSMLKQHNKKDDAWSAFNGKVYNITPYLPFHPGGEKELMRVAGRDGTKLFGRLFLIICVEYQADVSGFCPCCHLALTHAWVNVDFMLDACLVGFLVSEPSP